MRPTITRRPAAKPVLAVFKLGEIPRFIVSFTIKGSVSKLLVAEITKEPLILNVSFAACVFDFVENHTRVASSGFSRETHHDPLLTVLL